MVEAGKTWPEAEADVSEAIDFCEYYARQALSLARPDPLVQLAVSGMKSLICHWASASSSLPGTFRSRFCSE